MGPARTGSGLTRLTRALGALGITAFIGWYAVDFALTRGSTTIEFAAWLWVALLGWLVVVVGILDLRVDLGDRYHGAWPFERSGRLYRALLVPQAKRFMPNGDYAVRLLRRFRRGYRLIRDRESASRWEQITRSKEGSHLVHLVLTLPLVAYLLVVGALDAVAAVLALDIVFDLYPILVQRFNRMRIHALLRASRSPRSG